MKISSPSTFAFMFLLCVTGFFALAQSENPLKYIDASTLSVYGKAEPTANHYYRIDTARYPELPPAVKRLLTNPAGLFLHFRTNSQVLNAKWCVTEKKLGNNMTAIMAKGLDVYIRNEKTGDWQFAGVGRPGKVCTEYTLVDHMDASEKEFLVYLPLWDVVKELKIGINENSSFEALGNPFDHKVLIYGSSIVHGASASRPGMAYPARLSRATGINFVNLGVSGSAKMERAVADMIAGFSADAYILDCVPNSSPEQIKERTNYLVRAIRKKHPNIPIMIIPTIVREHGHWNNEIGKRVALQNKQIQIEYDRLIDEGIKDLYFLNPGQLLGSDHEGTTDGTHPNDLGFHRMIDQLEPKIVEILSKYPPFRN